MGRGLSLAGCSLLAITPALWSGCASSSSTSQTQAQQELPVLGELFTESGEVPAQESVTAATGEGESLLETMLLRESQGGSDEALNDLLAGSDDPLVQQTLKDLAEADNQARAQRYLEAGVNLIAQGKRDDGRALISLALSLFTDTAAQDGRAEAQNYSLRRLTDLALFTRDGESVDGDVDAPPLRFGGNPGSQPEVLELALAEMLRDRAGFDDTSTVVVGRNFAFLMARMDQLAAGIELLNTPARQDRHYTIEFAMVSVADSESKAYAEKVTKSPAPFEVSEAELATVRGFESLMAPRVTTLNAQAASISLLNQVAYVRDFEVVKTERGYVADPIIGVLNDGVMVESCVIGLDERRVALGLSSSLSELLRPIPVFTTYLMKDTAPVTIQLPQMSINSLTEGDVLKLDTTYCYALGDDRPGRRNLLLLVRVKAMDLR